MSTAHARTLRKNMTDAEKRLWQRLNRRQLCGVRFRRQAPIGNYIADFVCFECALIVELDGGQHADQTLYDERRTHWLESQGFCVLRFWNNEVLENTAGVLEVIRDSVEKRRLPPP